MTDQRVRYVDACIAWVPGTYRRCGRKATDSVAGYKYCTQHAKHARRVGRVVGVRSKKTR